MASAAQAPARPGLPQVAAALIFDHPKNSPPKTAVSHLALALGISPSLHRFSCDRARWKIFVKTLTTATTPTHPVTLATKLFTIEQHRLRQRNRRKSVVLSGRITIAGVAD
ncbi:hypothetical protein DFJ73DRAFT_781162 [Zopfochytrium polystomum]|nr:hypothetical protein DFJ73DRAFT_781162 [Zopfochytrium polystomum]